MTEVYIERVHTEQVVLDIGGDIGALIILTDESRRGDEIELSPQGPNSRRVHNQVHERNFNGRSFFAAVYPELHSGTYDIWHDEYERAGEVVVVGGEVASVDWRFEKRGHGHGESHRHSHEHGPHAHHNHTH